MIGLCYTPLSLAPRDATYNLNLRARTTILVAEMNLARPAGDDGAALGDEPRGCTPLCHFHHLQVRVQGYLGYKKPTPPRTLQ